MHTAKRDWHERFYLYRQTDITGYSGTGVVAEGVRWEDGTCTVRWCVPGKPRTTVVYESILDVAAIHGHDNSTTVVWMDHHDDMQAVMCGANLSCHVVETGGQGDAETAGYADTETVSPAVA